MTYSLLRQFALAATVLLGAQAAAAPLTIGVSTTPLSTPFYIAEKQGYFAKEGLEVALKDCNGGKTCLSWLLSGEVQLATASELPVMFSSFTRKDTSIVASFAATNRNVKLVTRKGANIRTPRDLSGKRVGLVRGAAGEYFLDLVLLAYGIDPATVTVVDLPADAMEAAAKARTVDVFAAFEPSTYRLMKAMQDDGFVMPLPAMYTMTFNLATLRPFAAGRQDDVRGLLRALDRAIQFIHAQPAQAQAIMLQRLKLDQAFLSWAWSEYRFDLALNQSLLSTLESQARWALRHRLVTGKDMPDYLDMVDTAPLLQVRPAAVTMVK